MSKWMSILLKEGWQEQAKGKAKVYPLGIRDKKIVDIEFDKLHQQGQGRCRHTRVKPDDSSRFIPYPTIIRNHQ